MHIPHLIIDLAVILGVAAFVTFLFRRIKQPVVLGYIVAGIIVGPHTPATFSVTDNESIRVWAELGVIFLMFTLGLEFSFRRLARVGMPAGVTAIVQIGAMMVGGVVVGRLLGWPKMDSIFLGCMISISSTTIIIKAFEELGLKGKRFAEMVFGILIVEDLAAILMLVALTNIATTSQIGGVALLVSGLKLALVVGVWFVVGMFLVPRAVRAVSEHGTDEMLTVMAIGLCLALVALAANFNYSVALGAFVMGSILAESAEAKRIEHLVQPLKDVFGAVFFVSVGMLLDPRAIVDNWLSVLVISGVIIVGNLIFVTAGALGTGQTVRNSIQTSFSMAQIGEFSFIIATLGLTYQVISPNLYPIIVAASLITTFTTPYLIKCSPDVADLLEEKLPPRIKTTLDNYVAWIQRRTVASGASNRAALTKGLIKWSLNGVGIFAIFTVAAGYVMPVTQTYVTQGYAARGVTWLVAFVASCPSIYAMLTSFRGLPTATFVARLVTAGLVGLLSVEYFPALISLAVTLAIFGIIFIFFRRQIGEYYRWIEDQFRSGFQADLGGEGQSMLQKLAPWDAHLAEIWVPARSKLVGQKLLQLNLRERYGMNVVVIVRDGENIVAPRANECVYPGDKLLCFATEDDIEKFRDEIETQDSQAQMPLKEGAFDLRRFKVERSSRLNGVTIRDAGLSDLDCIVVGLERQGQRWPSPKSDLALTEGDVVYVVGQGSELTKLRQVFR